MTPRSFLDGFKSDSLRARCGEERLRVRETATLGVVLMGPGGPSSEEDITPYLFRLMMDPIRVRVRWLPRWIRERGARFLARRRATGLEEALQAVGGSAPEIRLLAEQARALEIELNRRFELADGLSVRAYTATRYGSREVAATIAQMRQDGVTHVVIVPMCPLRLSAVTDSCVAWWEMAAHEVEYTHLPTSVVWSHGERETFIQAASDRIDEAIQRFPRPLRDDVHLVFALHPAAAIDSPDGTPEQTPLAELVSHLSENRKDERPRHLAYVQNWGLSRQPSPVLVETLEAVASAGGTGVVVVPVGFTTETMETAYELDVVLRSVAEAHGLQQIEIASGLNCHALYVRTLADAVRDRLFISTLQGDGTTLPVPAPSEVVDGQREGV